jgi:hypothetical protein
MSYENHKKGHFNLAHTLHELAHYLPTQAPLKDFIHHNTLHAFQHLDFHCALHQAADIFGFKTYLSLKEYRKLYAENQISDAVLAHILEKKKGSGAVVWKEKLLSENFNESINPRIGNLRSIWNTSLSANSWNQNLILMRRLNPLKAIFLFTL